MKSFVNERMQSFILATHIRLRGGEGEPIFNTDNPIRGFAGREKREEGGVTVLHKVTPKFTVVFTHDCIKNIHTSSIFLQSLNSCPLSPSPITLLLLLWYSFFFILMCFILGNINQLF